MLKARFIREAIYTKIQQGSEGPKSVEGVYE